MRKFFLPIFWKSFIAIVFTVAVFAFLNISFVWNKVFQIMETEISKRGINISKNLANQSIHYILYKDLSGLQRIADDTKKSDIAIVYCFITDNNNQLLAHTFLNGFPKDLLKANKIKDKDTVSILRIQASNYNTSNIKDIMVPILNGRIGYVRVGVNNDSVWLELRETIITFIIIFIAFTVLGLSGAYLFSNLISIPIKKLKFATLSIEINNLENKNIRQITKFKKIIKTVFNLQVNDEIDDLTEKFEAMILRLEKTYQELNSTQNAMNQSEKLASIGTLVSGVAHEINNPLSGLQSCIRRIAEHPDNITQNIKYIHIMDESTNKIQNVVSGLLNFTRVSSGQKEKNDITKIIKDTINLIKYRKSFYEIDIVFNSQINELYIECNKNEMEQVFFNLLKNSIDAIEEKFKIDDKHIGKIDISMVATDAICKIIILDNGIGISKENINKIFDPFYTTKDVGKGTGLGCSICYNIVKDHNGDITIESEHLKWTSVKLSLKLN